MVSLKFLALTLLQQYDGVRMHLTRHWKLLLCLQHPIYFYTALLRLNGLFNHFVSCDTVPILCIDKAHTFLTKHFSISKEPQPQANLMMERLCKFSTEIAGTSWKGIKESALEYCLPDCLFWPSQHPNNSWAVYGQKLFALRMVWLKGYSFSTKRWRRKT